VRNENGTVISLHALTQYSSLPALARNIGQNNRKCGKDASCAACFNRTAL